MHALLFLRAAKARCAFNSNNAHLPRTSTINTSTAADDILSILNKSTATQHPSNLAPSPAGQQSSESATMRFIRDVGLDRPSATSTSEYAESERLAQYQRQIYRQWQPGDVYAPHDLSGVEQKKWKQGRKRPQEDAFDILGINPVLEYKVRGSSGMWEVCIKWNASLTTWMRT